MGTAKTKKATVKMPKPLGNYVVFKNPAKNKTEEEYNKIEETAKKLPKKEQEQYFKKELASLWESITIEAVATECRWLKPGDVAIGTPEVMQTAQPTPDGEFLIVRETAFNSVW